MAALKNPNGKHRNLILIPIEGSSKFSRILAILLMILILAACELNSSRRDASSKEPSVTRVTDPIFSTALPKRIEPMLTLSLPKSNSKTETASALIWLRNEQMGIAAQNDVLIAEIPVSDPAVQNISTAQSAGGAKNPTLLTSTTDRSNLAWISNGTNIYFWNSSQSIQPDTILAQEYPITGLSLSPFSDQMAYATIQGQVLVNRFISENNDPFMERSSMVVQSVLLA